jgi:hypothetical protein
VLLLPVQQVARQRPSERFVEDPMIRPQQVDLKV